MVNVGKINRLRIIKEVDFGLYLDGGDSKRGGLGEILLPIRYVPKDYDLGDEIDVFIYFDSEDRVIATTETPYAMVGDFALLKVASITAHGVFFDWGLPKDLLLPFNEQFTRMDEKKSYIVRVFIDLKTGRIAATAKINAYLHDEDHEHLFAAGEKVDLFNAAKTDLGYKMIINNSHWGLLHHHEVAHPLRRGERLTGFIKNIREDSRINLCLYQQPSDKSDKIAEEILSALKATDGFLHITDKSSPAEIKAMFNISKASYKKAIGHLYRQRKIILETGGIRLRNEN
ncbi:MAG: S1-like domain-containing RNA-binding protein [Mariprofundaceae bacterium]|nr:S1-like domain-containing RNA-binding protein [Mariprofundaceae bacterium]